MNYHDNLVTLAESRRELESVPSCWTVRRFLKAHGLCAAGAAHATTLAPSAPRRDWRRARYAASKPNMSAACGTGTTIMARGKW